MLAARVEALIEKIKREDKKINAFIALNDNAVSEARALDAKKSKGRLYGKVIAVKSNINVYGLPVTCASKTLENYRGSYDATVIEKIREEDGLIIGMTNMDEFAAGSSGESSAYGTTSNPRAPGFIPGGSSSGSAAAVAAGFCDMALGSDTGGSIRNPASYCGVVGVKPSYGAVSRYGLIDLAMSLDQVGTFASNVDDAFLLFDVIRGEDEKDTKSVEMKSPVKKYGNIIIGIPNIKATDERIQKLIDARIAELKNSLGWKTKAVTLKHIGLAIQTYYPLVYTEFFSATRKFDGRRYGRKIEDASREEVLRRILGGCEVTRAEFGGAYYQKALAAKEKIADEFSAAFDEVDCIITPTVPTLPWKIGAGGKMTPEEVYASDALTAPVNLAEACAVSLPAGEVDGIPVGLQITCAKGNDDLLEKIARDVERAIK